MEMHTERKDWLKRFKVSLETKGPTSSVHHLVQLGVEDPGNCNCLPCDIGDDDVLGWLHENHREFNKAVWEMIISQQGMIGKLRLVLQRDLRGPDEFIGKGKGSGPFGRIVLKEYGRELLDHFVRAKPNPAWI